MSEISEKREVIEIFQRGLDQSAFVLKENPEITFPQIYNRVQWKSDKNELIRNKLEKVENKFKKPWLKLLTRPVESSALMRTLSSHNLSVDAFALSPDGKKIVSGSYDRTLRLWDKEPI